MSGGTCGARRITRALRRKGIVVARCTVERLMGELGLEGVSRAAAADHRAGAIGTPPAGPGRPRLHGRTSCG
ncbi:IS3 family transposase [Streptomyces longwoodensis]|uniref:IS3 family transposase n=1 Tax=Streptomyces longwoodensis TaxID=68231 RepID=UPI0033ECF51E